MQKTTAKKTSTIKTVVVRNLNQEEEFKIDTDIFDDPFFEAATRCIENRNASKESNVDAVIHCWDKKDSKAIYTFNTYYIMIFAGLHKKAELVREKFFKQFKVDLQDESIMAK